jgi:hypothetical protein
MRAEARDTTDPPTKETALSCVAFAPQDQLYDAHAAATK